MEQSLITDEVGKRITDRLEFCDQDENYERAGTQYAQYKQDVKVLLAEVARLSGALTGAEDELVGAKESLGRVAGFL